MVATASTRAGGLITACSQGVEIARQPLPVQGAYGNIRPVAPVAQLDRVLGYEPRGRGFNSCRAHHYFKGLRKRRPFFFVPG